MFSKKFGHRVGGLTVIPRLHNKKKAVCVLKNFGDITGGLTVKPRSLILYKVAVPFKWTYSMNKKN